MIECSEFSFCSSRLHYGLVIRITAECGRIPTNTPDMQGFTVLPAPLALPLKPPPPPPPLLLLILLLLIVFHYHYHYYIKTTTTTTITAATTTNNTISFSVCYTSNKQSYGGKVPCAKQRSPVWVGTCRPLKTESSE
jgi:hypothetical protein